MGINKIIYGGETLIDLSGDTVTAETLAEGITAHRADGEQITGTMTSGSEGDGTELLNSMMTRKITKLTPAVFQGVTEVFAQAFYGCTLLESVEFADSVTSIGNNAFRDCKNLVASSLSPNITNLESYAFLGCTKLALTSLPEGLTNIGNYAFRDCKNIEISSIPKGVTNIGNFAFFSCPKLTSITFKGTPTSIGANAFSSCSNLKTVNVPWAEGDVANAPWGATVATINYNCTV